MSDVHESQSFDAWQPPGPLKKSVLRPMTLLGTGLVVAGALMVVAVHPRRVCGATQSVRLQWEQRQQRVDQAVTSQERIESTGTATNE